MYKSKGGKNRIGIPTSNSGKVRARNRETGRVRLFAFQRKILLARRNAHGDVVTTFSRVNNSVKGTGKKPPTENSML